MTLDSLTLALPVLVGALIMVFAIIKFLSVINKYKLLADTSSFRRQSFLTTNLFLMFLFLIGYGLVSIAFLVNMPISGKLLVSIGFFFGAVYIYMRVVFQSKIIDNVRRNYMQTIKVLVSAIEARDAYTKGHSEHVSNLLILMYPHISPEVKKVVNMEVLEYTGLLHDLGKMGVPESILNKSGRLNDEEWNAVKRHVTTGEKILNHVDGLQTISKWVLYHHERIDGKGYLQVESKDIPEVSKIISVVDTYSALVTDRPYRKGKSYEEAIEIMKSAVGTQLDERSVEIFCSLDKDAVINSRPKDLINIDLESLSRIEEYIRRGGKNAATMDVLDREAGLMCVHQLLDVSRKRVFKLSVASLTFDAFMNIETKYGYHAADALALSIGEIIRHNVRNSDVVIRISRGLYLLALPRCNVEDAKDLIERINHRITSEDSNEVYDNIDCRSDIVQYNPEFGEQSFGDMKDYLDKYLN